MEYVLYRSRPTDRFESGQIFTIIEASARNNPSREVTGFLVYARDTFLQFVEGPAAALDGLLQDLRRDERHADIEILARGPSATRAFPSWRMERLAVSGDDVSVLQAKLASAGVGAAVSRAACEPFVEGGRGGA